MVGATGFEPATPCSQNRCATKLRHAPNYFRSRPGPEPAALSRLPTTIIPAMGPKSCTRNRRVGHKVDHIQKSTAARSETTARICLTTSRWAGWTAYACMSSSVSKSTTKPKSQLPSALTQFGPTVSEMIPGTTPTRSASASESVCATSSRRKPEPISSPEIFHITTCRNMTLPFKVDTHHFTERRKHLAMPRRSSSNPESDCPTTSSSSPPAPFRAPTSYPGWKTAPCGTTRFSTSTP